jgi:proteic killer suppression protein
MIRSFKDKTAQAIFERQVVRRFGVDVQRSAYRKLVAIHLADEIDELRIPPGNRLEKLKGDRQGQHRIRINDQWRVCFIWKEDGAHDVEIVDYH